MEIFTSSNDTRHCGGTNSQTTVIVVHHQCKGNLLKLSKNLVRVKEDTVRRGNNTLYSQLSKLSKWLQIPDKLKYSQCAVPKTKGRLSACCGHVILNGTLSCGSSSSSPFHVAGKRLMIIETYLLLRVDDEVNFVYGQCRDLSCSHICE